ncbi:hypothetical protein AGMMS4952_10610 [Spirochaetia bacterium]|nr:hypothetical protein AGMMS4952_10610 [Spirochaetia bacterium]
MDRFNDSLTAFLTLIGAVFIPVYTAIFLEYFLKKPRYEKPLNLPVLAIALTGMIGYRIFSVYAIFVPTLLCIVLVGVLIVGKTKLR